MFLHCIFASEAYVSSGAATVHIDKDDRHVPFFFGKPTRKGDELFKLPTDKFTYRINVKPKAVK